MAKQFPTRTPGEDEPIRGANQPHDPDDPVAIAEARERQLQGLALAEAAGEGREADIAQTPAGLVAGKGGRGKVRAKARMPDGSIVEVDIEKREKDVNVELYGPEVALPKGTAVRQDGTRCQGSEQPYGIIGDVMTPHGRLVSRVIPYDSLGAV